MCYAAFKSIILLSLGGFSHWHGIRISACLLGHFFAKFGIAIGGFSSETKEPKLHKLGVFGQIIVKSTQFDPNWVLFFRKWYTDGWEIWQKIGIEIVRFSRSGRHIHVPFWWKNPPWAILSSLCKRYWIIPWLSVQRKRTRKEVCLLFLADRWHLLTNPIHFYRQCTLIHLSENAVRSKLTHSTIFAWGSSPWRKIRQRILISVCNWQDWAKNVTEVAMVFASYRRHLLTDSHINQGQ